MHKTNKLLLHELSKCNADKGTYCTHTFSQSHKTPDFGKENKAALLKTTGLEALW